MENIRTVHHSAAQAMLHQPDYFASLARAVVRRSVSVVCLNRGMCEGFPVCKGLLVWVQKNFFWCEKPGIGLRFGG